MTYRADVEKLIDNLHNVAEQRQEFAGYLNRTVQVLQQADSEGEKASGKLSLGQDIQDLEIASKNLAQGCFRLMVLGDTNHGKSTLLNTLLGKDLLPRAARPCTAILSVLQFGSQEKVTVYFKDSRTEVLSFDEFNQRYTIDPEEAKRFEESKKSAFPDVSHAVVEYPLAMLQNGVEIVDSPGLNDTEERNQLTLSYVNNCHAILFVLNATKPCTLEERRYLENNLKGRGLTIFFLVNRWDELAGMALDPEDPVEVRKAEEEQRKVFKSNLYEYCQVERNDLYDERVFETSGLKALRRRLKGESLDGTGLPEFIGALERFLTKERAIAEFRQIRTLMRQTHQHTRDAVASRIPLLAESVDELKRRIKSVEPEFRKLREIRDCFKQEITQKKDNCAEAVAKSTYNYISRLDETFETDFKPYIPNLNFLKFLLGNERKKFEAEMKENFQKYVNDRMSEWSLSAERDIKDVFSQLSVSASQYGAIYGGITDTINAKLSGGSVSFGSTASIEDRYPAWARFATGTAAFFLGDFAGAAGAGLGTLNWKGLLINLSAVIGVNAALYAAFGTLLTPLGAALVTLFASGVQMGAMHRKFIDVTRKEMKKNLPNVADQQAQVVYQEVKKLFDSYDAEVSKRMNEDIESRQAELDRLVEQKEKGEFQREAEIKRLKDLEDKVYFEWQGLESAHEKLINAKA